MTSRNVPELRINGFEGDWYETTIGKLSVLGNGRDYKHLNSGNIPVYGTGGYMLSVDAALSNDRDAVGIGRKGTIDNPYLLRAPFWTVDTLFYVIPNIDTDLGFLHATFQTIDWKTKNTASGVPSLTSEAVTETVIGVPIGTEERHAIGALFTNLDTTVTTHRKKLALLKQTKTSLLQRMFPKDGADEPELRLEGFSDNWKEELLADIATYSKGKGYSKADMTEEGTPLFHYGRLYTKYELAVTDVDIFSQVRADSILSRGGEVLVPASGETAEDIATASALLQPGVLLGGDLNVIRPHSGFDSVFLALSLSHGEPKAALAKRAQGKSVVHVHNPDIQSLAVLFPPTLAEQRAIGALFRKLDALISAEAQYIDKLTQTKTALLQKMFV